MNGSPVPEYALGPMSDAPTSAEVPPATASAPGPATGGAIVRIPSDTGGDPLVRSYLERFRSTCAWSTLSWAWVVVGMVAALIGGAVGSHLGGPVAELSNRLIPIGEFIHAHYGNLGPGLLGMAGGAMVAGLISVLATRRRIPTGQEVWMGAMLVAAIYLVQYDLLIGFGILLGLVGLIYAAAILFRIVAIVLASTKGGEGLRSETVDGVLPEPVGGWPVYTVLVPLYHETNVAGSILANLAALDYPRDRLDVKLLLEADDPETLAAIEAAGIPAFAEVVIVPEGQPKTKPRACNHGLARARGEFTVIFDAEDRPEPDQLKQAVLAFRALAAAGGRSARVACLQAQLAYHNFNENLLTRWFAIEYNVWFRRYLGGLVRLGVPIPLGGTSNHFRTAVLHDLGGWDPFNVTEDCDLGVRLYMAGHSTRTLRSVTWEEAVNRFGGWVRQRSRWLKGYAQTHLVWARQPLVLVARLGPWGALGFFLSVFCVSILAALNLVMWSICAVYLSKVAIDWSHGLSLREILVVNSSGEHLESKTHLASPMLFLGRDEDWLLSGMSVAFFIASILLFLGNFAFIAIALYAGRRPGQRGLWWAALLSPLYWILISLGAWKGLWQLVTRPHYWEKTMHGNSKVK